MARKIIYVEQKLLDKLNAGSHFITDEYAYFPLDYAPKIEIDKKIEIVPSPRPVPREHLIRDISSELSDLQKVIESLQDIHRHIGYMKEEL